MRKTMTCDISCFTIDYTTINQLPDYSVPGKPSITGDQAAITALALPITVSLQPALTAICDSDIRMTGPATVSLRAPFMVSIGPAHKKVYPAMTGFRPVPTSISGSGFGRPGRSYSTAGQGKVFDANISLPGRSNGPATSNLYDPGFILAGPYLRSGYFLHSCSGMLGWRNKQGGN